MKDELLKTQRRISPYIHNTPVFTSRILNEIAEAEIFFKCENFQRMGAFKMRGASNAILQLTSEQKSKGVVTHSSGNFAQAVALAAKSLKIKADIIMPASATKVKKSAVRGYGGIIHESGNDLESREKAAQKIQNETGATFIHPSNDDDVINGNATAAMELLEKHEDLDFIFTPVGGGGLIAGTALAAHYFGQNCKVIGGEPFEADDAYRSLKSGKIEGNITQNTIADGLKSQLGDRNFPIIQKYVPEIIRVEEMEILEAMQLIWERMKIIVEPSSAVAFAALLKVKNNFKGKKLGLIISGGNVDLSKLPF